jgi:hypothetical protein
MPVQSDHHPVAHDAALSGLLEIAGNPATGTIRTMWTTGSAGTATIFLIIVIQMYFINAKLPAYRVCGEHPVRKSSLTRHCRGACDLKQGRSRSKHSGCRQAGTEPPCDGNDRGKRGAGSSYAYLISEVQWPQRVALRGMVERQKGHSLVVGAAGAAAACWR